MKKQTAFSLVELSIVLVILGLLTGGILAGQSLIRASELRAASTELQRYTAAVNAFRDKYFQLPGDFSKATDFWTSLGGTGSDATCQNISATGTATCNGNGNGDVNMSVVANDERRRLWQHMANAGLIEGQYTGVAGSGGASHMVPGNNMPRSRLEGSAYHIITGGPGRTVAEGVGNFGGNWGMTDEIRATDTSGNYIAVIKPEELWNLDTKMDDGKPGSGIVRTYKNQTGLANCLLNDSSIATATYNLAATGKECLILFTVLW